MKSRNACHYAVKKGLSFYPLSKTLKKLHRHLLYVTVRCGRLLCLNKQIVFENNVLRKIFGPKKT
jgi:hypothetical protein